MVIAFLDYFQTLANSLHEQVLVLATHPNPRKMIISAKISSIRFNEIETLQTIFGTKCNNIQSLETILGTKCHNIESLETILGTKCSKNETLETI
jgi:hypothetical protein